MRCTSALLLRLSCAVRRCVVAFLGECSPAAEVDVGGAQESYWNRGARNERWVPPQQRARPAAQQYAHSQHSTTAAARPAPYSWNERPAPATQQPPTTALSPVPPYSTHQASPPPLATPSQVAPCHKLFLTAAAPALLLVCHLSCMQLWALGSLIYRGTDRVRRSTLVVCWSRPARWHNYNFHSGACAFS